jgi:hypothetical protein
MLVDPAVEVVTASHAHTHMCAHIYKELLVRSQSTCRFGFSSFSQHHRSNHGNNNSTRFIAIHWINAVRQVRPDQQRHVGRCHARSQRA